MWRGLWLPASFTQPNGFQVCPWCGVGQDYSAFYGWTVARSLARPQFIYLLNSWWPFQLFPPFSYFKQCCSEHNICVQVLFKSLFSIPWGIYLEMELLCVRTFSGTTKLFSTVATPVYPPWKVPRVPVSPHPWQHLSFSIFWLVFERVWSGVSLWLDLYFHID